MITASNAASSMPAREGTRIRNPVFDMAPFALPSAFWNPSYVRGSLWLEHLPFCFWAIEAARPVSVVTTGADSGFPHFALCEAVLRLRLEAQCIAILNDQVAQAQLVAYNEENFGDFARIEVAGGMDIATVAPSGIDLLVLAGHGPDEEGNLANEWDAWRPKLSERAVVLIPRIESEMPDGDVAWKRICSEHPHYSFRHGGGLGVVGVGSALPELFHHLLGLEDRRHAELVRAMFARLGASVAESHRHAVAKRGLQRTESRVRELEADRRITAARHDAVRQELEADIRVISARHDAVRQELAKTTDRLERAEADLQVALKQNDVAACALEQAKAREQELESKLLDSSRSLELQAEHAQRVAAAIEVLKRDHEAGKIQLAEARRAIVREEAVRRRVVEQMQSELKRGTQRIQGLKGEIARFRKKLEHERELHLATRRELTEVLGSRSWSLTAPLRRLNGWLRKSG